MAEENNGNSRNVLVGSEFVHVAVSISIMTIGGFGFLAAVLESLELIATGFLHAEVYVSQTGRDGLYMLYGSPFEMTASLALLAVGIGLYFKRLWSLRLAYLSLFPFAVGVGTASFGFVFSLFISLPITFTFGGLALQFEIIAMTICGLLLTQDPEFRKVLRQIEAPPRQA